MLLLKSYMASLVPGSPMDPTVAVALRSGRDTAASPATPATTEMAPVVYLASHVPLRVFRGRPDDDVTAWAQLAQRALAAADLAKEDPAVQRRAAAALESALAGAAADCVFVLPDKDRTSPSAILAVLISRFGALNASASARARLYAYRRQPGVSVNEFAATFLRRCHDVNPIMTDEERVSHFLRALDEPTAAHVLRQGVPTTLDAGIAAARNTEHAQLFMGQHTLPPTVATLASPTDQLLEHISTLTDRLLALESRLPAPTIAATGPVNRPPGPTARPRPPLQPNRRDTTRDRWTADGTIICNNCGQPGHKAAQCSQHPRNRPAPPASNRPRFL